jgi:hypothetical protein
LASIQDQLTPKDYLELQNASIFQTQSKDGKFRAEELYFPNEKLQSLGLPIILWKHYLRPQSEIGSFFLKIGLKESVNLTQVLDRVQKSKERSERIKLLQYLGENSSLYSQQLRTKYWTVEYIVCQTKDELKPPCAVYADPKAAVMGFDVIDTSLANYIETFGIRMNPTGPQLLERMALSRPTMETAREVFEYLTERISEFNERQSQRTLNELEFIPTNSKFTKPNLAYFNAS